MLDTRPHGWEGDLTEFRVWGGFPQGLLCCKLPSVTHPGLRTLGPPSPIIEMSKERSRAFGRSVLRHQHYYCYDISWLQSHSTHLWNVTLWPAMCRAVLQWVKNAASLKDSFPTTNPHRWSALQLIRQPSVTLALFTLWKWTAWSFWIPWQEPGTRVALRSVSSVGLKPYMCRHCPSLRLAIIIYTLCSRLLLSLFVDPKCCTIVCQWIRCSIICNVMPRLIWQNRTTTLHCQWNIALRSAWLLAMMIQLSRRSKAFSVHSLLQVKLFKYLCFSAI